MTKAEEQLTDEEVFVPETLNDWEAKPLSLRNSILLVRLLGGAMYEMFNNLDDAFDEEDNITYEGAMNLLSILDETLLTRLLVIITDLDYDRVQEDFKLSIAVRVILDFWKQEELGSLLGEARKLAGNQEFQERQTAG